MERTRPELDVEVEGKKTTSRLLHDDDDDDSLRQRVERLSLLSTDVSTPRTTIGAGLNGQPGDSSLSNSGGRQSVLSRSSLASPSSLLRSPKNPTGFPN